MINALNNQSVPSMEKKYVHSSSRKCCKTNPICHWKKCTEVLRPFSLIGSGIKVKIRINYNVINLAFCCEETSGKYRKGFGFIDI